VKSAQGTGGKAGRQIFIPKGETKGYLARGDRKNQNLVSVHKNRRGGGEESAAWHRARAGGIPTYRSIGHNKKENRLGVEVWNAQATVVSDRLPKGKMENSGVTSTPTIVGDLRKKQSHQKKSGRGTSSVSKEYTGRKQKGDRI